MVDFYPKGVWLQKCFAIFTSGAMKEVPDRVLRSVHKSVLRSRHFFGRLRHRTFEVPEPTPVKWVLLRL